MPQRFPNNGGGFPVKTTLLLIAVLLALVIVWYLVSRAPAPIVNNVVVVSGHITTLGTGTHPYAVQFGSYQTSVTPQGFYAISLPDHQTYPIVVSWQGILSNGNCNLSPLGLNVTTKEYPYNVSC